MLSGSQAIVSVLHNSCKHPRSPPLRTSLILLMEMQAPAVVAVVVTVIPLVRGDAGLGADDDRELTLLRDSLYDRK